jgi:hypothetical protein
VSSDGFLDQFVLKGGPCDGKVVQNSGPKPFYVNERVRFGYRKFGLDKSAVYHLNADGTGTWLKGR